MHLFGSKDEGTAYGALIDISSGSIGFGIVESKKSSALPTLVYTHRIPLRSDIEKKADKKQDSRKVREALLSASLTLSNEGLQALRDFAPGAKITQLFITCSSPWAFTVARNVKYETDEVFKVTTKIIDDLIRNAEVDILTNIRDHSPIQERDYDVVERATVDISINDYLIKHPYNLKGSSLSLSHVAGLIPKEILRTVEEVQDKLLPGTELKAHTYMLVMYCVMRDILPKVHSSCIIDITGEATEFGIVENDLLISNSYIPQGSYTLVRECGKGSKRPLVDIQTALMENTTESGVSLLEFEPFATDYMSLVANHLNTLLEHRTLPEHIIISAHKPFGPLFKEIIEKAILKVVGKGHIVTCVDETLVHNDTNTVSIHEYDLYLNISARFFHKLHGCAEIEIEE